MATSDYAVLYTWCASTAILIGYGTQQPLTVGCEPSWFTPLTDFRLVKHDPRLQHGTFPMPLKDMKNRKRSVCVDVCVGTVIS